MYKNWQGTEMATSPEAAIGMGGDGAREGRRELLQIPYRDGVANTSCNEKALDISTPGLPFGSQAQGE